MEGENVVAYGRLPSPAPKTVQYKTIVSKKVLSFLSWNEGGMDYSFNENNFFP